jgi:hypothetical protein
MSYWPGNIRNVETETLASWVSIELQRVATELGRGHARRLEKLAVEPAKRTDGMLVYADGTGWDPGGGEGAYMYYAGTWNKLG